MLDHTRDELQMTLEAGFGDAKILIGELAGMTLAMSPDSDSANAMAEKFLADGGSLKAIQDGMKAMQSELKDRQRKADAPRRAADWAALSQTERDEGQDAARRIRESMGESQHHTNGKLFK